MFVSITILPIYYQFDVQCTHVKNAFMTVHALSGSHSMSPERGSGELLDYGPIYEPVIAGRSNI
jgi:hypothetical protein